MRLTLLLTLLLVACTGEGEKPTDSGDDAGTDADADGFTAVDGDCDDNDSTRSPGAVEECDGIDNNCDNAVDEGVTNTYFADADGDGYGDPAVTEPACTASTGYVATGDDCDDTDASSFPGAFETCDDADNDCDGTIDEDVIPTWYADADADGYGDAAVAQDICLAPGGYVADATDCDDADADVNPGAAEADCTDPNDYNCDGSVGYADVDGDGRAACDDCDDAVATTYEGASEACNGVDDDCDSVVDEDVTTTFYADADADGAGNLALPVEACDLPSGYAASADDCDDALADVNPSAPEICNGGLDDDCDGFADDDDAGVDLSTGETWYRDGDGDAHGDPAAALDACLAPADYVADSSDCDDGAAAVNPAATETCNSGVDDDCDGSADDADTTVADTTTWFYDLDSDGFGDPARTVDTCEAPVSYVGTATDCDDATFDVNPAATETCNSGVDDDCDGLADDDDASTDLTTGETWYYDNDGDSSGDAAVTMDACVAPTSYVGSGDDCNDDDAAIGPTGVEVCNSGVDDDCDGLSDDDDPTVDLATATSWFADGDRDGDGDAATTTRTCVSPAGHVTTSSDCNDADAGVYTGATEICNEGVDDDCDGFADDDDTSVDTSTGSTWYADADTDGYGDAGTSAQTCEAGSGYLADATDCDDRDAEAHPGASETWYDGQDQDCDGASDYDQDGDGDDAIGYGGIDEDDTNPDCAEDCSDGSTQARAGASCEDLLVTFPDSGDGTYWIDPDFDGDTSDAFEVECDMENGGWSRCFALTNTTAEDLIGNTWFDDCVDWTGDWTEDEVRVVLTDTSGTVLYDHNGVRPTTWSRTQLTSTVTPFSQYHEDNHLSLVTLDNGDKLMITGNNSYNSGCGGSFGNGYGIVVYPSSPDYYSNPKMLVMSHQQTLTYTSVRLFAGWTASNEISGTGGSSFNTCSSTPSQLGTFEFYLR